MKLAIWDLLVFAVYFLVTLWLGIKYSKHSGTTEGYFFGNRKIPGWAIALSMIGTSISAVTFLGYPQFAYEGNLSKLIPGMMLPVGVLVAVTVYLPFYRSRGVVTAYEYLERRFGPTSRVYVSLFFILGQIWRLGLILYLLSVMVAKIAPLNPYLIVIFAGAFVIAYTYMGGIEAVIWTDVIQTIVLIVGGMVAMAFMVFQLPHGFSDVIQIGIQHDKFNPGILRTNLYEETWLVLVLIGLGSVGGFASDQNVVQRYCAAKSYKAARNATIAGGLYQIPIWIFFAFMGTCMFAFYYLFPNQQVSNMLTIDIFPHFIMTELPAGLAGLLVAAVLAAAMSSLDSSLNSTSTVITLDIVKRHLFKNRDDAFYTRIAKGVTLALGVFMIATASIVVGIHLRDQKATMVIMGMGFYLGAFLGGGVLGVYLLGFFTTKANNKSFWIGAIASQLVAIPLILFEKVPSLEHLKFVHVYLIGYIGNIICFGFGYLAGVLWPDKDKKDLTNLTVWTTPKVERE